MGVFYNPSKIVTDLLSKYLEFDPEQLKLGIWSGNLSIQNVELKHEAMYPLLNGTPVPVDDNTRPPLKLKLVKGTIGQMRIRIPWKRLVWGQGDVKLQVSDVTIAVAYESREETAARNLPTQEETNAQEKEEVEDDEEETKRKREVKQQWLREAERCQLQGLPLPSMEDIIEENSEEEANASGGNVSKGSSKGKLDSWLKSTTESFAWRFVAGLDASIRNVRVVIVQDGVEIGTIFHSMDISPKSLDASNNALAGDEQDTDPSAETPADPSMATPPPDVVPEGEYDDGEHLDKIVKLQGFGVFVRLENKRSKSPKTLQFSASVLADDYILRPTEGSLAVSIFDPYPPGKQTKKKPPPPIEEEPTTPTTATATVDSVTSSKSRRSKREKRPLALDDGKTTTKTETPDDAASGDSERPAKQLRPALKRPERISSSTRQFSISETPTPTAANRPKSHTVDLSGGISGGVKHARKTTVPPASLNRVSSGGHKSRTSTVSMASRSIPLLSTDDTSSMKTPVARDGTAGSSPPSLDLHLSFGDVTAMFSSRHYQLILMFKSTVERMENGRPDTTIASCIGGFGTDKQRTVYVDAPTAAVKNVEDPAITSQLPPSMLQPPRPSGVQRAQTTGGVDFTSAAPRQRVKLQLQLELPTVRDENAKIIRSWWQYAYSTALYEVRKRNAEELAFDRRHLQFDWEKEKYKRKEYVELYIATRLEPSSVLRTMELKVMLGTTKSPEEALLKIEDELPVEQILLYRSIARSVRVRGMKKMPDSLLDLHSDQWLTASPARKKAGPNTTSVPSPPVSPGAGSISGGSFFEGDLDDDARDTTFRSAVETDCTDINGIRREADAVRMRTSVSGDSRGRKAILKRVLKEDIGEKVQGMEMSKGGSEVTKDALSRSTKKGDASDGRTVRTFKTAKTSLTSAKAGGNDKGQSSGRLRISASIAFTNVELMVYQENTNATESLDSMRFRPSHSGLSSGVLDARIRSSMGLQVVTNDSSSSEVSDVSILSDDQIFFEQTDDVMSILDNESVDVPIMSSADFLLFGLPRNVLLHAKVAGLTGKTRGQSGGKQIFSLEVDSVSVQGGKDSDLVSLKPTMMDASPPIEEVHLEKKKKKTPSKKKTAVSFTELETFQEQAVLVSVVSRETVKELQCDLSKVIVTCDLQAVLKIYDFFADVQVEFPRPLIASTEISQLRQQVMKLLETGKQGLMASDEGTSSAIRLHGLEIVVPGSGDVTSESAPSSTPEGAAAVDVGAKAIVSMHLIEFYDGSLFEDILSLSNNDAEDVSRMNEVPLSDKGWQRRNLSAANRAKLLDGRHPASSIHSVLSVTGIECTVARTAASLSTTEHKLLDTPVDVEVLLTQNHSTDFLSPRPRKQYSVEISPVIVTLSEARVDVLSSIALSLSGMESQSTDSAHVSAEAMLPRLAALSIQIRDVLELRISSMSLTCVEDIADIRPSDSVREIIMEESLSDFVSVLSCFSLDFPTRESVETAGNTCVDRLVVLGIPEDEAHDCVHAARLNFIAGINAMKQSQSQLMRELAESSQEMKTPNMLLSGADHFDNSAGESVPTVDEMSDDGSDESLDIIETTLKGAVEKTMSSFGPLLGKAHAVSTTFKELLVVDFPAGANVSMTRMFYDFRFECHFKLFHVRNASGLHLLSIKCPCAHRPRNGNEVNSSTAAGYSWEEDDGSSALSLSFFLLDNGYDFGEGGLPLATMGSHDEVKEITKPRQREQLSHVVSGQIEAFFSHDVVADAIESISRLGKSVHTNDGPRNEDNEGASLNMESRGETMKSSLYVAASSVVVTLASDQLVPFCQMEAKDCTIDNALTSDVPTTRPCLNVEVKALHVLDLTPEGYGYPDILYPMALKDLAGGSPCASLSARFFPSANKWREPTKVDIELCGLRLFVMRRFLNELLQYILSKNYGVGRLLDKFGFFDATIDTKGNPQPPFHYKVALVDSSIILPRSSTNVDMLALEVEKVTLFNGTAASSFRMPTAAAGLNVPPNTLYEGASYQSQRPLSFNTAVADSEFFDCVDSDGSIGNEDSARLSSFKKGWIKRTTVVLEKARLLTSLPSSPLSSRSPDDPLIHKFYILKGRAVQNGQVYTRRPEIDTSMPPNGACKKPARVWREITSSVCSLEVIADFVPRLRLLITDRLVQREDCGEILSLNLDMRLSDLCLVLSLWYSNMQELPVMFPYDPAVVEATATAAQPSVPVPEYGTKEYVERLKTPSQMKSDIALVVDALSIRGSFDERGYFGEDPQSLKRYAIGGGKFQRRTRVGKLPFKLSLGDLVFRTTTDTDGILRLGCGASRFQVVDQRRKREFDDVILVGDRMAVPRKDGNGAEMGQDAKRRAWADLSWGLDCSARTQNGELPQPFQASVFMTPGWCLTNVGFEHADAILSDFSPIWILVDYFASYFKSGAYGNPAFEILERKDELKRDLAGSSVYLNDGESETKSSMNVDFRLWLLHPCISVPESLSVTAAPSLSIDCSTGFWYHYRSIETSSLQEMGSTDLSLRFSEVFHSPAVCRSASMEREARTLIEGLSFGLRMDSNTESQHTDYVFRVPMFNPQLHDESALCSVASPVYGIKPIALPLPRVCVPFVDPTRTMGPVVSEVTLFLDALPVASAILQNLVSGPADSPQVAEECSNLAGDVNDLDHSLCTQNNESRGPSFSLVAHVDSFRMFAIDPILEKHLPVALLCVSPLEVNISQLSSGRSAEAVANGEAFPDDLQVTISLLVWADYFKLGTTRSWEPLLEPCRSLVLYERSKRRGHGISLNSDDSFHVNITGSLLLTLDENIRSFSRAVSQIFGGDRNDHSNLGSETTNETPGACVSDELCTDSGSVLDVHHEIPKPIPIGGRTAFSFRNLTGQKIRIHQLVGSGHSNESKSIVAYLDHKETTTLSFDATISVIRNLSIVEVPFPGLQNSQRTDRGASLVDHEVDVHMPGFRWLAGISVNTSGRKFDSLVPVSPTVLEKVQQDWRLQNAVKVLTEVGVENGGRLIAARSIFEVRNKTSHSIFLNFNPDPTQYPCVDSADKVTDASELVEPGASFQIPSLLIDASLELEGHHLGSFWLRPIDSKENKDLSYLSVQREDNGRESVVEFSSRPIQLAKLVHESALIFKSNGGEDLEPERARSGVQLSCPAVASSEGAPLAPFCYVVEVRRSPLVQSQEHAESVESPITTPKQEMEKNAPLQFKGGKNAERALTQFRARGEGDSKFIHGPVSYSLLIHPPLVVENLLPKRGRFELMHATRRTVLWFGDLNPGDRIPIHTVGLDAPLLLMVNLGFCRTPVGEGALVHHGSDTSNVKGLYNISHGGLKSIGKAVTKGTKQFAKAATAIAESPDKRGQGKVFLVQNPQFSPFKGGSKSRKVVSDVHVEGNPLGFETAGASDGKIHSIEHESFDPADVDDETVVVDSVGQRLTLNIDNVRGGGGQRRISLYCPLWIVNTTEHSLTYKQEKGSSFVSGTVLSPAKDGSRPVDDSDRNYIGDAKGSIPEIRPVRSENMREGIFSGTPGALAAVPGRGPRSPESIISLLDKDLPLKTLTEVAFMFNFQLDILSIFKLCVQLSDGTGNSQYSSAWSQGFSLDSVGVNQIVSMPCKDGRALEVSMTLSVAPGLLSGYTKIVRFTPRFVLVNYLERPVRIWQDSSLLHPLYEGMDRPTVTSDHKHSKWHFKDENDPTSATNQYEYLFGRSAALDERNIDGITAGTTANKSALYIATAGTSDVVPFHLPDTRGERQLRIDLGGSWNLTSSFSADATGENIFKISRAVDSRMLSHVATRASPQYRVMLPPQDGDDIDPWDGELGVWFETDWGGDRRIIVQGIKKESYAFNYTDIHVGDELLRVNDFNVSQMTFQETMKVLKEKLTLMSVDAKKSSRPRMRASAIILRRSKRSGGDDVTSEALRIPQTKVVLTFRTLEERLRRVRIKALKARRVNAAQHGDTLPEVPTPGTEESETLGSAEGTQSRSMDQESPSACIKVDMRMLHNTAFVVARPPELENPPFRIENRAMDHVIFFRQRTCNSYPWNQVMPGESLAYTWEEPLRPRKLVVRVGPSNAIVPVKHADAHSHAESSSNHDGTDPDFEREKTQAASERRRSRTKRMKQLLSAQYVENEEEGGLGASVSVKLEVIGFADVLPCPKASDAVTTGSEDDDQHLNCYVDTDGMTRVLIITDKKENEDESTDIRNHVSVLKQQIQGEDARKDRLQELRRFVGGEEGRAVSPGSAGEDGDCNESKHEVDPASPNLASSSVSSDSRSIQAESIISTELQNMAEFPEDISITRCHQVYVEVIEAAGLKSSDASGMCNPYCEVALKGGSKSRKTFRSKSKGSRKTYYIENTTTPKWATQVFIFDISPEAVHATRGFSVRVRLRNFHWIGNHPSLGQTSVYLSTLRNQQELVGWYPLVGTKERSDADDSLGSYSRGSVKLRMQWIHSVPGLLDYFLMLSERRLLNLQRSVDGMGEQLTHAIEIQKTREQYADTLGSFPIPGSLMSIHGIHGRRAARMSAGHIRKQSRESMDELPTRKLPRPSIMFRMRDNLRKSREMHLWQLNSETTESRRRRRSESGAKLSSLEPEETAADGTQVPVDLNRNTRRLSHGTAEQVSRSSGTVSEGDIPAGVDQSDAFETMGDAKRPADHVMEVAHRERSFSVPNARPSTQTKAVFRDDSWLLTPGIQEFSRLVRNQSLGGASSEGQGSVVYDVNNSFGSDHLWLNQRDETMETLYQRGFLHHDGETEGVYHDHLAYHVRQLLMDSSAGVEHHSSIQNFRGKSALRLSPVIREFRSWTAAQSVFNDNDLDVDIVNNSFLIKIKGTPASSHNGNEMISFDHDGAVANESEMKDFSAAWLNLPQSLPRAMRSRAMRQAHELETSRTQFESACNRSLRAVLNPGGWLTIRPMTALYLPDSCTGMFVKLRYGTEVVVSETVDGKVSPTWTRDTTVQVTPYAHIVVSSGKKKNVFEYGSSDLQVYIDPQRTSGSLRLSVVGERMNKTKVELGVLHIPLGAAINCCVECMDEIQEDQSEEHKSLRGSGVPAYVRWFPLMNPKDVVSVDGDLGHSSRPFESEQMRDNMFVQYFTPCVKLAFIWQPDEDANDNENDFQNKRQVATSANDLSESPVAETYCNADVGRVSLALIDSQRAVELVSLYVTDIDIRYSVTKAKTTSGLFLGNIQIDYQDDNAREPVVLAPTPGDNSQPTLQFVAVKDNLRSKSNITSYEYIWFTLQEMDLSLEESWMFDLWEFFMGIISRVEARNMSTFGAGVLPTDGDRATEWTVLARTTPRGSLVEEHFTEPTLLTLLEDNGPTNVAGKKMYVGQLVLGYVKINLSYLKGKKQNWEVNERGGITLRDPSGALNVTIGAGGMIVGRQDGDSMSPTYQRWSERTQDEELWTESEVKYSNLPKTFAQVFPSVSDAPIRLQGKVIEHVFESPDEIFNSIKGYYKDTILSQIYKIIGALDFVGNPSMLVSSFFSGVRDFFVTPSQAFLRTPKDPSRVGMGVAKGTLSLFSHSASGVFGFISKMSASAGQVVAVLSLDDEFRQWHSDVIVAEAKGLNRQWKRRGVQSVPTMVARPLYDVVRGLTLGMTGVVVNPYIGARRRGCPGFAKGVAAGTIGIIAKPVAGVFDAFSHASGSAYDVAKSANVLEKRYLPPKKLRLSYSFGPKGVLMPYDQVAARSMYLLETHPMKVSNDRADTVRALGNEIHVASEVLPMEPGVETYAVASSHRIVLFQVKKESGGDLGTTMLWQVDLTRTSSVSCKLQDQGHNGVALIISTTVRKKKVRIARMSPERKAATPSADIDDTTADVPPLSLYETANQVSTPFYPYGDSDAGGDGDDDDEQASELLGIDVSDLGNKPEFGPHGSMKGKDGEVLEWYTIVAEYQQGRQLNRIHNAVCCIIGDFGGVSPYRSGNQHGITEGYTSFGELFFGEKPLEEALTTTPSHDKAVCEDLNMLPWIYPSMFHSFTGKTPEKQHKLLGNMRKSWLFSREVSAVLHDGTPAPLVDTRARSVFIPHSPPSLPASIEDGDEVVAEILAELKQGNISYDQACGLIESHAESMMVSPTPEGGSEVSSVTEGHDTPFDQLFQSAVDREQTDPDMFHSAKQNFSSIRTPSEIRVLGGDDRPLSQTGSTPGDFYASRSSLPFLDTMDSGELLSLADKSLELQSLAGKSLKSAPLPDADSLVQTGASTASLPLNASRGARESLFVSARSQAPPMRPRTESAPAGLAIPKSPQPPPATLSKVPEKSELQQQPALYDSWVADDVPAGQSRLSRMESMLEQLIIMNARQISKSDGYTTPHRREEPEMMALRQEIADLRSQVHEATTDGSRSEMIAALRKEVKLLKQELKHEKREKKRENDEASHVDSQGGEASVSARRATLEAQLNKARPAAVQFARGLERRADSVAGRIRERVNPTIPEEESEGDRSENGFASF